MEIKRHADVKVKGKIKVHTLDIAPLRSESPPQKRSGMARILKGSQFYLHTHTFIRNRNEPYLSLPNEPSEPSVMNCKAVQLYEVVPSDTSRFLLIAQYVSGGNF